MHDNTPPSIVLRTDSKPAKPPGVALPLAVFVVIDMLAMLLMLDVWR